MTTLYSIGNNDMKAELPINAPLDLRMHVLSQRMRKIEKTQLTEADIQRAFEKRYKKQIKELQELKRDVLIVLKLLKDEAKAMKGKGVVSQEKINEALEKRG